jgi:hypothetical protein
VSSSVRIIVVSRVKATRENHDSTPCHSLAFWLPCHACALQLGGPCECFGCGERARSEEGLLQ